LIRVIDTRLSKRVVAASGQKKMCRGGTIFSFTLPSADAEEVGPDPPRHDALTSIDKSHVDRAVYRQARSDRFRPRLERHHFNLSSILGPALAGVLIASLGAVGCFALNAATYLPCIWVALWILPRGSPPPAGDPPGGDHLLSGVADIARTPHLRGALLAVLLTSTLCGPLIVFCPVLVKEALQGDVGDFSLAIGAFGVGGLIGAIAVLGVDAPRFMSAKPVDPECQVALGETRPVIDNAIDQLPMAFRQAFILRTLEQLSVGETAEHLDVPKASMKTAKPEPCLNPPR
jgi:hypothetical protein